MVRPKPEEEAGSIQFLFRREDVDKIKLIERLRDHAISILKPITEQDIDLKNFDHAVTFCTQKPKNIIFRCAINLLRACTSALESSKVDQSHIDWIVTAYHSLSIIEQKQKQSSKGGKKEKLLPGIFYSVKKLFLDNKRENYSAERLWKYFEDKHKGKKNAFKVNSFKIYFDYKNRNSDEERIFQISKDGIVKSRGRSAFNAYVKAAKKSLK